MKLAAVALDTTPLDWKGNLHHVRCALNEARDTGARLVCFPELVLSGAGCEDAFLSPFVAQTALDLLRELLPDTHDLVVAVGLPLRVQGKLFNAAALIDDGKLLGFAAKKKLADDRLSYESRWFSPWTSASPSTIEVDGVTVPLGKTLFESRGMRIALSIGSDVEDLPKHVDVVLNLHARAFSFGAQSRFEAQLCELTTDTHAIIASSNLLGNEAGSLIYAGGALVVQSGQLLARSQRFSFCPVTLASAEIRDCCTEGEHVCASDPFSSKEEEFTRAVALGLFGYLRKSRMKGFVVSLSGGADSAAVASLVMLMARFSIRELGSAGFIQALGFLQRLSGTERFEVGDGDEALEAFLRKTMPCLLTTAYQATRHSSPVTREAARALAQSLGSRHLELDVEPMVTSYRTAIEEALDRSFAWEHDDTTLQNIQARARAPGIWMIANAQDALLLTTSNRSEAAVGYATMDGDTCGGLAPIVGIDKAWLRHWLMWLEREGPRRERPLSALAHVNIQAPTAELRPAQACQTDENDLMPYSILNELECLAVHRCASPRETFDRLSAAHPEIEPALIVTWVTRFFGMFARSQWKRERSAPGFHLDDANLSPRSWCRFPILNGGFEQELTELQRQTCR